MKNNATIYSVTIFNSTFLICCYLCLFLLGIELKAQNIGINGSGANAHPSALLDIDAVATPSLGLLIPRIALQATNLAAPVSAPATSLLVYNTATASSGTTAVVPGYYYWDGAKWASFNTSNTTSTSSSSGGCLPTMVSNQSPTVLDPPGALEYCMLLTEGGFTDWRLPNVDELNYAITDLLPSSSRIANYIWTKSPGVFANTGNGTSTTDGVYTVIREPNSSSFVNFEHTIGFSQTAWSFYVAYVLGSTTSVYPYNTSAARKCRCVR